jgi:hypothetical protein
MSYQYSNGLCTEALRIMASNDKYESRLVRAFGEMGVSRNGDTSDEIWKEWKDLDKKYHEVSKKKYELAKGAELPDDLLRELEDLGQSLVYLCCNWIEYNSGQIGKGKLRKAS